MNFNRGFTLVEVMISLCIIMICVLSITKLSILAYQSESYGEGQTYAAILGNSRLASLRNLKVGSPELGLYWHQDSTNPITIGNSSMAFYRFWMVDSVPGGLEVTVYVAWDDKQMGKVRNFSSMGDLSAGTCPKVEMGGFVSVAK